MYVGGFMKEKPEAEFVAVADVFDGNAQSAKSWAGGSAEAYQDFRHLLDRKDVDAVLIATPDHWHAAIAILAMKAGKDVYVEKPLSHSVHEGRLMAEAAKQTGRVAQAGLQHRSAPHFEECAKLVQSGAIGTVHYVRVWNTINFTPLGIGKEADCAPPPGLNWDFYCGPAPLRPYNCKRFIATFRWFWDYSGGYITDFGTHRFATVHHIMNATAPRSVVATGRRFAVSDAGEIPDVLQVSYEYPAFNLSYEGIMMNGFGIPGGPSGLRYYNARGPYDRPNGMVFYGTNGTLIADRIGYEVFPEIDDGGMWPLRPAAAQPLFRAARTRKQGADATRIHAQSFVDNVKNRAMPVSDMEMGHRATSVGHLGNISYKTGLKLKWDAEGEKFIDAPPEASALLFRKPRAPYDFIG